jgi:hypothetical protein
MKTKVRMVDLGWGGCLFVVALLAILAIPASWVLGYCVERIADIAGNGSVDVPLLHPLTLLLGPVLLEVTVPVAIVLALVGLFT